ncbi:MAG: sulfatase-like hydrolase/transferase, partial [Polyangia bacterium]
MRTLTLALLFSSTTALAAHPVFDLVANRTLAHAERAGALSIAAGSPGFARYVHFSRPLPTWKLRQTEDGKHVALAQTQAVLEVPLTAAQAHGGVITLRLKSPVKQTVRATVSGKSSPAVPLAEGWQTAQLTLPAGALVEGENKIVLGFANSGHFGDKKASAAVEWIDIGPASAATAPPAIFDGGALTIAKGDALSWYVMVPSGGALTAHAEGAGCSLQVHAAARGAAKLDGALAPNDGGATFDLGALADKVARLSLSADGGNCAIKSAALTAGGDAPTVKHAPAPKNVVFWMTDDTRSDKFKLYNPKTRVETPIVDLFAKRATNFKVAYVQGNESRVSHASLWTSLYPLTHHFIAEKAKLDPKFVTLPEAIKPTGRSTIGLMGNGFIDAFWGFGEGWDILKNHIHEGGGLKAEDFVVEAKQMLQKLAAKPFFMYIGTIDAHVSWRAHAPWIAKYDPEPYAGPFVKACLDPQLDKIVGGKMAITERDKTRIVALYDSDVSYNDQ